MGRYRLSVSNGWVIGFLLQASLVNTIEYVFSGTNMELDSYKVCPRDQQLYSGWREGEVWRRGGLLLY